MTEQRLDRQTGLQTNPKQENLTMQVHDLSAFRESAAQMKTREGFGGTFVNFNGETGHWTIGSGDNKKIVEGRRLVVGVSLLMVGWQKFVSNKPFYDDVGFVRNRHQPRPRKELGDLNRTHWRNDVDPWQPTYFLAALDPETREHFMFATNSGGGKDALSDLQTAFADHNEARPDKVEQWPFVELSSESYINSFGKKIHKPLFEILDWLDPPPNFQAVTPPATTVPKIEHKPGAATSGDGAEIDDEIPF
jgi:hypothetical protein